MLALERRSGGDGLKAGRRRVRVGGEDGPEKVAVRCVRGESAVSSEFIRRGWSINMAGYKAELSSAL